MYSHVYIDLPYTCHVDLHCLGNRVLDHMQDDQTVREAAALCLTQLFQYLSTASRRHILGPYILYKDIQPTTLVLKAGHPASFSSIVLCVYSFVSSDGGFLGFFLLSILLLYTLYNTCTCTCAHCTYDSVILAEAALAWNQVIVNHISTTSVHSHIPSYYLPCLTAVSHCYNTTYAHLHSTNNTCFRTQIISQTPPAQASQLKAIAQLLYDSSTAEHNSTERSLTTYASCFQEVKYYACK